MSDHELPNGIESRAFDVALAEVRTDDGHDPIIAGHAAVFNSRSVDMGGWREVIEPGAFRDAIPVSNIRSLFNHDPNIVLGSTAAGTLTVSEDERGLYTETQPPDTQLVRDMVLEPMRRGDITQMSFAFRVKPDGATIEETDDGTWLRTIRAGGVAELYDASVVTYPAYPDTTVAVRSIAEAQARVEVAEQEPDDTARKAREAKLREMHLEILADEVDAD